MRSSLTCALLSLLLLTAPSASAQDEAPADAQEDEAPADQAQNDEAQSDEEILETVPVDDEEAGTDSELPPDEDLDEQVFYSGFGLSKVSTDFDNLKDAVNLDVVLGFRIPTVPWVGIEIDLGQTVIPGENKRSNSSSGGTTCTPAQILLGCTPSGGQTTTNDTDEFAMRAYGASLVLKSTGKFYALGRLGYRYVATSIDELNVNRSGTGFGVGAGYRWGKGLSGVQIQYQQLSDDIDAIGITFFARTGRR